MDKTEIDPLVLITVSLNEHISVYIYHTCGQFGILQYSLSVSLVNRFGFLQYVQEPSHEPRRETLGICTLSAVQLY